MKCCSSSISFKEQNWHNLRCSGILGVQYLLYSIINLWLLVLNFATLRRWFVFFIRSKWWDLLLSGWKESKILVSYLVEWERIDVKRIYRKIRCICAVLANKIYLHLFLCLLSRFGRDLNPIRDNIIAGYRKCVCLSAAS